MTDQEIILNCLPVFLLVKLDHTCTSALEGLEAVVIVVEPLTKSIQIHLGDDKGLKIK
ncbi:hypothetical protein V8B97DRAFT_1933344 [Scleroderma yunnanense]